MATVRRAARVILLDADGRVLLFFAVDPSLPDEPGWWFTPGGGVEGSESLPDAAIREVREETGLQLASVDGPVSYREADFTFEGERIHQVETYFSARVEAFEIDRTEWTELEQRSMGHERWWTVDELKATSETVYPENLVALVSSLRRE